MKAFQLKIILNLVFLISINSTILFGQKKNTTFIYFDEQHNIVRSKKESVYFLVKEKESDTTYHHSYYKKYGPLIKFETYKDKEATIQHGFFAWYRNGVIDSSGMMMNNQREGEWIFPDQNDLKNFQYKTLEYKNGIGFAKIKKSAIKGDTSIHQNNFEKPIYTMPLYNGDWVKSMQIYFVYPKESFENGISGQTILGFLVLQNGEVENITIQKSVDYFIDRECKRVLKLSSGKWLPGKQNGNPVVTKHEQKFILSLRE